MHMRTRLPFECCTWNGDSPAGVLGTPHRFPQVEHLVTILDRTAVLGVEFVGARDGKRHT